MVTIKKRKIEMLSFVVTTTSSDKTEGKRCDPNHCMYKISTARSLYVLFPSEDHHHRVKVDAGTIRFFHAGYHYTAPTPRLVKSNMLKFDASLRCRECKRIESFCPRHDTRPHEWKCEAVKGHKLRIYKPHTRERQGQINTARQARVAAGKPDRIYRLRQRVVGFT